MNLLSGNLFRSTALYALSDGINKAIPFLVLPIIVRYLTPEDYGIITNYTILVQILAIFVYSAAQGSIPVNFFKYSKQEFQGYVMTMFSLSLAITFFFFFLFLIFGEQICSYLGVNGNYLLLSLVEVQFSAYICVNLLMLRCEEKPIVFGSFQVAQTCLSVGMTILFVVFLKWACEGKIIANLVATLIMGIISACVLVKKRYCNFRFVFTHTKTVLLFALPLIPHALALWGKSGIDKVLITNFRGLSENGIYSTALTWSSIIAIMINSFGNAYTPYVLKRLSAIDSKEDKNAAENKRSIVKTSYAFLIFVTFVVVVCYGLFYALILFIYPKSYHQAVVYLPWLLVGEYFRAWYMIYTNFIYYTLNTKVLGLITFLLSMVQFVLSYILISQIGTMGAAVSTCVVSFLIAFCVCLYSNHVYPMPWTLKKT